MSSYIIQRNLLGLSEAEHEKHQNLIMVGPDQTLCAIFSHFSRALQVLRGVQHPAIGPAEQQDPTVTPDGGTLLGS